MTDRCDAAWLAAYALGLATAGRDDRDAVADLAQHAWGGPDTYCRAIDRLAACDVGGTADRQRAIDLLARAAEVPTTLAPRADVDEPDLEVDLADAHVVVAAQGTSWDGSGDELGT